MYNQSAQLNKHEVLKYLITNYPKYYVKKFNVDSDKVRSFIFTGLLHRVINKIFKYLVNQYQVMLCSTYIILILKVLKIK